MLYSAEFWSMVEIKWVYTGPNRWHYQHNEYVIKKKDLGYKIVYEIWKHEILQYNNLTYFDMLKHYNVLILKRGKYSYNSNFEHL